MHVKVRDVIVLGGGALIELMADIKQTVKIKKKSDMNKKNCEGIMLVGILE